MQRIKGFAFAMEWSWRRRCGIFGRSWYSLDKNPDEFVPFTNVFEARQAEIKQWNKRLHVAGEITRSFVCKFELVLAMNRSEESEVAKLGSLVIFTRKRFDKDALWNVLGSGKEFLVHFKPYKRVPVVFKTLELKRGLGHEVRLASWKIYRLTPDHRMAANWPPTS